MWFRPPTQIAQFAQPVQLVQLAQFVALVNVIASTFLLSLRVKRAHTSLVDNACSAWAFTTNLEQLASACGARLASADWDRARCQRVWRTYPV